MMNDLYGSDQMIWFKKVDDILQKLVALVQVLIILKNCWKSRMKEIGLVVLIPGAAKLWDRNSINQLWYWRMVGPVEL